MGVMVPNLILLADSRNREQFDRLNPEQACQSISQFMQLDPAKAEQQFPQSYSQKRLVSLARAVEPLLRRADAAVIARNKQLTSSCGYRLLEKVINTFTCSRYTLKRAPIDRAAVMKKIKALRAPFILQRAFRHRFRKRLQSDKVTYEEWKVQRLQARWKDNTAEEVKRLQNVKCVQWPSFFTTLFLKLDGDDARDSFHSVIGRAQEIKEMYRATHYVFTHGQSLSISVINSTVQQLIRHFSPSFYHPLAPSFRMPKTVPFVQNVDAFFKRHNVDSPDFSDNRINLELLSVDGYFFNTGAYESAIDFLCRNDNICTIDNPDKIKNLLRAILTNYLPNDFICKALADKLHAITVSISKASKIGVLYTICVPKVIVEDPKRSFVYRSHPFGIRCPCHPKQHTAILERLQKGEAVLCNSLQHPQYRLITSRMVENEKGERTVGVRSFGINALPKATNGHYQKQILECIQAFYFYSRLFVLETKLTAAQEATLIEDFSKLIRDKVEINVKIAVPLIRRRSREGLFSSETRDLLFQKLGIKDNGSRADEYWITARATAFNLDSLWSAVSSVWSIFESIGNFFKF